jgi:DNA-binding HxlR family transcriptional regulator
MPEDHCQAEALKLLGDYVTLRIVDYLRDGVLRFTELQRSMGDVNSVTLSNRLKRLEQAGVIQREEATIDRQSVAYRLSEIGSGLVPVLREIQNFTKRNLDLGLGTLSTGSSTIPRRRRPRGRPARGGSTRR